MKILSFLITPWKKFQKFMNWEASSIPDEAIEFQPDALEIANSRLPIWARYSVVLAFIFLAGALIWATLGKVDVIVTGNGKIVSALGQKWGVKITTISAGKSGLTIRRVF